MDCFRSCGCCLSLCGIVSIEAAEFAGLCLIFRFGGGRGLKSAQTYRIANFIVDLSNFAET